MEAISMQQQVRIISKIILNFSALILTVAFSGRIEANPAFLLQQGMVVPQSPDTIANLKLWLKADSLDGTADGTPIGIWNDSSSNGFSVSQATSAYQPVFKTNQVNGKPVLRFDGTHMSMKGAFTGSITDKTMFVVVRLATLTPGSAGCDPVSIQTGASGSFDAIVYSEYTQKRWHNGSDYFTRTPATVSPTDETSTSPLLIAIRSTTSSYILYRNGSQLQSTASYSPITFNAGDFVIGQRLSGTTNGYHNGDIAEILIYNRALTSAERLQVEDYLNKKYGLW